MGNSSSHSTHNHGSKGGGRGGPPPQHYVHSLPRDGRGGHGSSMAAAQKHYNGGFKVLPERVPGQKLRLTDNGSVLHNGGTLSGRKLGCDVQPQQQQQPQVDPEFMKVLRRRSDSVQEMRREEKVLSGHQSDIGVGSSNSLVKKYHSDPDLLNAQPGMISVNPSGLHPEKMGKGKKKKMLRKTKAPPAPAYDEEDEEDDDGGARRGRHQSPPINGIPATRDRVKENGRRGFASFLKPSSKAHKKNGTSGNEDVRSRLSVALPPRQEGRHSPCLPIVPHPPPPPPQLARLNAEVTAAKLDSRDKSVTYVLERRHECNNGGSVLSASSSNPNGSPGRRYTKRTQSPDCGANHSRYSQHQSLQSKLSDSEIASRSIDRSDVRNGRLAELQKRVRSMDSLACAYDDRDIFVPQHRPSNFEPARTKSPDVFVKTVDSLQGQGVSRNSAPNNNKNIGNDRTVGMGRRLSNSSSQLSDGQQVRPLWEKSNLHRSPEEGGAGSDPLQSRIQPSPSPRECALLGELNFPKPYFYGGKKDSPHGHPSQNVSRNCIGSNKFGGESMGNHLRSTSDLVVPHDRKVTRELDLCDEFDKNLHRSQWNRNVNHVPKEKLKPINSKEILATGNLLASGAKRVESKDFQDNLVDSIFPQSLLSHDYSAKSGRKAANDWPLHSLEQNNELSSEDEMDINMQLRPTLPKRLPTLPRFSPTQVWRSFSLDEVAAADQRFDDRSSDGEEGDVFEDRIHRIARPVAPPRSNNEKSADSGISPGANSPTPVLYDFDAVMVPEKHNVNEMPLKLKSSSPSAVLLRQQHPVALPAPISPLTAKEMMGTSFNLANNLGEKPIMAMEERKPTWTPEEDLASDFDAASGEHPVNPHQSWNQLGPEMVSSQPKLISRKDMFFLRRSLEQEMKDSFPDSGFKDKNSGSGSGGSNIGIVGNVSADGQGKVVAKRTKANRNGTEPNSPQTYNSVRKLKRSLSGVLQGQVRLRSSDEAQTSLDDNWSLSRSLPNSLHNGLEGGRRDSQASARESNLAIPKVGVKPGGFPPRQLPRSESGPVYPLSKQAMEVDKQLFADLEGRVFSNERAAVRNGPDPEEGPNSIPFNRGTGHIVYLPKYEAMEIISNNADEIRRRAYSDLGMSSKTAGEQHYGHGSTISVGYNNGPDGHPDNHNGGGHFGFRKPKKFTYQSTVRQIERKQLEQKLSEVVAVKEKQRAREMDLVKKVEEEFQRKRDREKVNIRQQLRILSLESSGGGDQLSNSGYHENTRSLPRDSREYATYESPDRSHGHPSGQSNRQGSNGAIHYTENLNESYTDGDNDRVHNSLPPMIIPPEDYDMTLGRSNAPMGYGQPNYSRGSLPLDKSMRRLTVAPESSARDGGQPGSSFFSGIGKWMWRQRVDKHGMERSPSRLEPEGAPSSFGANYNHCVTDGHHFASVPAPPAPYQQTRSQAVAGAKFSSGRMPNGQFTAPPPDATSFPLAPAPKQRKSIYSKLAALTEKEEMLQKQQGHGLGGGGEAKTAVWISSDRNPSAVSSRPTGGMNGHNDSMINNSFYEVPYDSLGRAVNGNGGPPYPKDDHSHRPFHSGGTPNVQRDWSAGQRHSIAVDFSGRDKWTPNSYCDNNPRWDNHESLSNIGERRGPQGNGGSSIEPYWQQRDSEHYRQPVEGNSLDYRRRYVDYNPPPIGIHQRSLSFNQIWDGGEVNNQKLELTSPRQMAPNVQLFGPNKAYHPVGFPVGSRGAVN